MTLSTGANTRSSKVQRNSTEYHVPGNPKQLEETGRNQRPLFLNRLLFFDNRHQPIIFFIFLGGPTKKKELRAWSDLVPENIF